MTKAAMTVVVLLTVLFLAIPAGAQRTPPRPATPAWTQADIQRRVTAALEWLKDHQNIEGFWSASRFDKDARRVRAARTANLEFVKPGDKEADRGAAEADFSVTGLSVLAFLGAGSSHKNGPYSEVVQRAITYLQKSMHSSGRFGPPEAGATMPPAQAVCTLALLETYTRTKDSALASAAELSVKYILSAQNPDAGWRDGIKPGVSDTQYTAWMVLALRAAGLAGLDVNVADAYTGARAWLDSMTREDKGTFTTGYAQPGGPWARPRTAADYENWPVGNACNLACNILMKRQGFDAKHKVVAAQAKTLTDKPPQWAAKKCDYEYIYWGSLALFQVREQHFDAWMTPVLRTLLENQRGFRKEDRDTFEGILCEHGSWDAVDPWASHGGRVWGTAINALTLQLCGWHMVMSGKGTSPASPPEIKQPDLTAADLEKRIRGCLEWLIDHQGEDGRFSVKDWADHSTRKNAKRTRNLEFVHPGQPKGDAPEETLMDVPCTALAVLAFAGMGYTHKEGHYNKEIKAALDFLLAAQDEAGGWVPPGGYDQLIHATGAVTAALAELFVLSKDKALEQPLQRAVRFLLSNQARPGGWRWVGDTDSADTQMTSWAIFGLAAAQAAGIQTDYEKAFAAAEKFLATMTVMYSGTPTTGYATAGDGWGRTPTGSTWASPPVGNGVNIACNFLMRRKGWDAKNKTCAAQVKSLLAKLPEWADKKCDYEYWFWATQAMSRVGGADWDKWFKPAIKVIAGGQRGFRAEDHESFEAILDEHGSFDALDPWWAAGGRVWSTAINCLTLEMFYRHLKRIEKK